MGRTVTVAPAPVAVLLVELARRGIELRAAGDRLRYHHCPISSPVPVEAHQGIAQDGRWRADCAGYGDIRVHG